MGDFPIIDVVADLVPTGDRFPDPDYWWGNALRGALGVALRLMLCQRPKTLCRSCPAALSCEFPRLFSPERQDGADNRGPRYRLAPWLLDAAVEGRTLRVHLRLFGPAASDPWRWTSALGVAAARGIGPRKKSFTFAGQPAVHFTSLHGSVPESPPPAGGPLTLRLLTPLRLVANATPVQGPPSFEGLLAAVERRLRLAHLCWSDHPLSPRTAAPAKADGVAILHHATRWRDFPRFSRRQRRRMRLGGLVGDITYGEGWQPWWRVLATAAVLHVGKLTTMGFGKVAFDFDQKGPG